MKKIILLLIAIFLQASPVWALKVPPLVGQRVHDLAGVLDASQKQALSGKLAEFEKATSNQIAVLIVNSLEGEPIENFSLKVAESWKIGQKGKDNGLLITIAAQDKKYRFEVGYGLEGALPDGVVGSIGRQYFRPNFQRGDYYTGISQAVDAVMAASRGEYQGEAGSKKRGFEKYVFWWLIMLFVLLCFFYRVLAYYLLVGAIVVGVVGLVYASMLLIPISVVAALAGTLIVGALVGWFVIRGYHYHYDGGSWSSSGGGSGGGGFSGGGGSFGGGGASGGW